MDALSETVSEVNKTTPNYIDPETRLDTSFIILIDTSINYKYTLTKLEKSKTNLKKLETLVSSTIEKGMKKDTSYLIMIRNNVKFNFLYYDKEGKFLTKVKYPK